VPEKTRPAQRNHNDTRFSEDGERRRRDKWGDELTQSQREREERGRGRGSDDTDVACQNNSMVSLLFHPPLLKSPFVG